MAIDDKYGEIEIPGVPPNEPVFILRAQDRFAVSLILIYKSWIAGLSRLDDKMLQGLRKVVHSFSKWPTIKTPDSD